MKDYPRLGLDLQIESIFRFLDVSNLKNTLSCLCVFLRFLGGSRRQEGLNLICPILFQATEFVCKPDCGCFLIPFKVINLSVCKTQHAGSCSWRYDLPWPCCIHPRREDQVQSDAQCSVADNKHERCEAT